MMENESELNILTLLDNVNVFSNNDINRVINRMTHLGKLIDAAIYVNH